MIDDEPIDATAHWLSVVGKALAYLCLQEVLRKEPGNLNTVLKQVESLQGLGLSIGDAALAAGSSEHSVRVMISQRKSTKAKNGRAKKKSVRRSNR